MKSEVKNVFINAGINLNELNGMVAVSVLIFTTCSLKVTETLLQIFVRARFARFNKTPLILSSDLFSMKLPVSIFKFRKFPAIWITLLLQLAFIISEVVIGFGLHETNDCKPQIDKNPQTISRSYINNPPEIEVASMAYLLLNIQFRSDENFSDVRNHFPKIINDSLCIPCLNKTLEDESLEGNSSPDYIISDCTEIRSERINDLFIGVKTTKRAHGTVVVGFRENKDIPEPRFENIRNNAQGYEILDYGDLIHGRKYYSFLFVLNDSNKTSPEMQDNDTIVYMGYGNQDHLEELLAESKEKTNDTHPIWEKTRGPVFLQEFECKTNKLHKDQFVRSLLVFRSIATENLINPIKWFKGDPEADLNDSINIAMEDIYKAVLALKIAEDVPKEYNSTFPEYSCPKNESSSTVGNTHRECPFFIKYYTNCGYIDVTFAIPLLLCILAFGVLIIVAYVSKKSIRNSLLEPTILESDSRNDYESFKDSIFRPDISLSSLDMETVRVGFNHNAISYSEGSLFNPLLISKVFNDDGTVEGIKISY